VTVIQRIRRGGKIFASIALLQLWANSSLAESISPLQFVAALVEDLGSIEDIRTKGVEGVQKNRDSVAAFSTECIRTSTSLQLELNAQVQQFGSMQLAEPYVQLPSNVATLWQERLQLELQTLRLCKSFLAGERSDKDLQVAAGEIAEIGAKSDYIDQTFFKAIMPMAMMALVSDSPDSEGHMSKLVVTRKEIVGLANNIDTIFGDKLAAKNPNYLVASVVALRRWLESGYKASDE
jgi:hypothetical protein